MARNNNKTYGLGKEREVKKMLLKEDALEVTRSRGSFGSFDVTAFFENYCKLISVKSVRAKRWSPAAEIRKLQATKVPDYCQKELWIWWSPRKDRAQKGWERIVIYPQDVHTIKMRAMKDE